MRFPLALALSAALVLAACGDDSDSESDAEEYAETSVEEILEDVKDAMADLESVRIAGSIVDNGQELQLDVQVNTDGECEGSIGTEDQGSFELIHLDGVSYFKPDEEFWRAQAGDAADQLMSMAGDKWVTNSEDTEGFGELCDLDNFVDALGDEAEDSKVEGTEEIDGTDTVKMTFTSEEGNDGLAYVAGDDPHRIVRFDVETEGQVDFTDFDAELSAEKPAADDIFDLASLG